MASTSFSDADWRVEALLQAPSCCRGSTPCPTPPSLLPSLLSLARLQPGDTLVDLGCGAGGVVLAAAAHCPVRAVGIDANRRCLEQCFASQATSSVLPSSVVEWHYHDITMLRACAFAAAPFIPSRTVFFVHQAPGQLESVYTMLRQLVLLGARVITYDHHLIFPDEDVEQCSDDWSELLAGVREEVYAAVHERAGGGAGGGAGAGAGASSDKRHTSAVCSPAPLAPPALALAPVPLPLPASAPVSAPAPAPTPAAFVTRAAGGAPTSPARTHPCCPLIEVQCSTGGLLRLHWCPSALGMPPTHRCSSVKAHASHTRARVAREEERVREREREREREWEREREREREREQERAREAAWISQLNPQLVRPRAGAAVAAGAGVVDKLRPVAVHPPAAPARNPLMQQWA